MEIILQIYTKMHAIVMKISHSAPLSFSRTSGFPSNPRSVSRAVISKFGRQSNYHQKLSFMTISGTRKSSLFQVSTYVFYLVEIITYCCSRVFSDSSWIFQSPLTLRLIGQGLLTCYLRVRT